MSRLGINLNVLGDDAASPASASPAPHQRTRVQGPRLALDLDVVSDVICPWCYVGKRRLERALTLLGDEVDVRVRWRPFQLNPSMPRAGVDRAEYRRAKFGSLERSQALDARLVAVGATEGIDFRFDQIARTPNTLDAHRLIRLAEAAGIRDAVVEALFRAYFLEGVDIGQRAELVAVVAAAGLGAADAEACLVSGEGLAEVQDEERQYKEAGVSGVPTFFVNGRLACSGAAEPQIMAETLRNLSCVG